MSGPPPTPPPPSPGGESVSGSTAQQQSPIDFSAKSIYFDFDKSIIKPLYEEYLVEIADYMKANKSAQLLKLESKFDQIC